MVPLAKGVNTLKWTEGFNTWKNLLRWVPSSSQGAVSDTRSFTMWCPLCTCPIAHHTPSASRPPLNTCLFFLGTSPFLWMPTLSQGPDSDATTRFLTACPCPSLLHNWLPWCYLPRQTTGCWEDRKSCLSHAACIGGVTMTREPRGVQEQGTWVSGAAGAVTNSDQQTGSAEATQLKLSAQDPRAENFWPMDFSMKWKKKSY